MDGKKVAVVGLVGAVVAGALIYSAKAKAQPVAPILITEDNNGQTVYMLVGQTIHIELQYDPTTGYEWSPTMSDMTPLKVTDFGFLAASEFFIFQSTGLGTGTITLESINGDGDVAFGFTLNVVVVEVLEGE